MGAQRELVTEIVLLLPLSRRSHRLPPRESPIVAALLVVTDGLLPFCEHVELDPVREKGSASWRAPVEATSRLWA